MPTIPRPETFGGIQRRGLPTPDLRPSSALPGIERSLEQPMETSQKMLVDQRKEADQVRVLVAADEAYQAAEALLRDPQKGALFKKGVNALELPGKLVPEYEQALASIRQGLATEGQRRAFDSVAVEQINRVQSSLNRHSAEQYQDLKRSTLAANLSNAYSDAWTSLGPGNLARAERKIGALMGLKAQMEGNPAAAEAYRKEALAELYAGVATRLRDKGQFLEAEKYLASKEKQIPPDRYRSLQGSLLDSGVPFRLAFESLSRNPSGFVPQEWADRLTPDQVLSLAKTKQLKQAGQLPTTTPEKLADLRGMVAAATQDPDQRRRFLQTNLSLYWPDLSPADYAEFQLLQKKMAEGKGSEDKDLKRISMNQTVVNGLLAQVKRYPPKNPKMKRENADFQIQLRDRLTALGKGNDYTDEDLNREAATLLKETVIKEGWFGPIKGPAFLKPGQVKPEETKDDQAQGAAPVSPSGITAPVAPELTGPSPSERTALALELAANGKAVTPKNIQMLWERKRK